jgi:hypothetical protein
MAFKVGDKIVLNKEAELYSIMAWAEDILEIIEVNYGEVYTIRIRQDLDGELTMEGVPNYRPNTIYNVGSENFRLATQKEIKQYLIKKNFIK